MVARLEAVDMLGPFHMALIALALSVAGNAAMGWAWQGARDAKVQAVRERDDAQAAATACSDATEALQALAAKRAKEAAPARVAAAKAARTHTQRADKTLATAPKVPGDMCASMQALGDDWLRSGAK